MTVRGRVLCGAPPSDPERRAADAIERAVRGVAAAAASAIATALAAGDPYAAVDAVDWFEGSASIEGRVVDLLDPEYRAAWVVVADGGLVELPVDLTLRARVYAATRAGELAKVLLDRETVRVVIMDAVGRGMPVPAAARAVVGSIGLDARSATALGRYAANAPAAAVDRYARRLLRNRAVVIARTEMAYAANAGRLNAWEAAQRSGALGPDARKRWVTAHDERTCSECGPMDGQTVALSDNFGHGAPMPPRHPRCRCTAVVAE